MTDSNSFEGEGRCMSCGHDQRFRVPKGKTPLSYAHKIKCGDCGNNAWRVTSY